MSTACGCADAILTSIPDSDCSTSTPPVSTLCRTMGRGIAGKRDRFGWPAQDVPVEAVSLDGGRRSLQIDRQRYSEVTGRHFGGQHPSWMHAA